MSALIEGVFRRLLLRSAMQPDPVEPAGPAQPAEARDHPRLPAEGSALLEWIDGEDRERAQAVHLIDRSEGGLAVRSPLALEPGWAVLLTVPGDAPLKAVVRHRRRDSAGWILGVKLIRRELRRFDRRPIDCGVELSWQGADGRNRRAAGRVRDVGEGGLQLVCGAEIPLRASVLLFIDGWQRFGTVVHARPDNGLRVYGVQFSGPPILLDSADFDE